jgi:hypothetical protein
MSGSAASDPNDITVQPINRPTSVREPGLFERITRAGRPGSLFGVLGQTIYGPTEGEELDLERRRAQMSAIKRQEQGLDDLTQMLPEEQRGLLGPLLNVSPEATTQGLIGQLFGQDRAEPAIVRTLKAAGIDPQSDEGQEIIRQSVTGGVQADLVNLMRAQLDLQNAQREQQEGARSRKVEENTKVSGLETDLGDLTRLAELVDDLDGTALQPGTPFSGVAREAGSVVSALTGALNSDSNVASASKELVAKRDEFDKISQRLINEAAQQRFGDSPTNQQVQSLRRQLPSSDISPSASRTVIADELASRLRQARDQGIDLGDTSEVEALIKKLKAHAISAEEQAELEALRKRFGQ